MQKKFIQHSLLFDLLIQLLLIRVIALSLWTAVFFESGVLFFGMFALIPLGIWQLGSALVWSFLLRDNVRRLYLITAIVFSSLFLSAGTLLELIGLDLPRSFKEFAFFTLLLVSFAGAIYYFIHSYRWYQLEYKHQNI